MRFSWSSVELRHVFVPQRPSTWHRREMALIHSLLWIQDILHLVFPLNGCLANRGSFLNKLDRCRTRSTNSKAIKSNKCASGTLFPSSSVHAISMPNYPFIKKREWIFRDSHWFKFTVIMGKNCEFDSVWRANNQWLAALSEIYCFSDQLQSSPQSFCPPPPTESEIS